MLSLCVCGAAQCIEIIVAILRLRVKWSFAIEFGFIVAMEIIDLAEKGFLVLHVPKKNSINLKSHDLINALEATIVADNFEMTIRWSTFFLSLSLVLIIAITAYQ